MADRTSVLSRPRYALARGLTAKLWFWLMLGAAGLFVFVTTEVLLVTDYPLYHGYRMVLIADRYLFVPHAICGTLALLIGPVQFSSRIRQRYLKLHRVLGRVYVVSVFVAAPLALAITWNRTLHYGTLAQATAWMMTTGAAIVTARNRQIAQHRQWMARSYAVTFTFILLRLLNLWPRYWNMSDASVVETIIVVTFGSVLAVDLGLDWRELTTSRRP